MTFIPASFYFPCDSFFLLTSSSTTSPSPHPSPEYLEEMNDKLTKSNLELKEQIEGLTEQLKKREAQIIFFQNVISNMLTEAEIQVNKHHKKIQEDLVNLAKSMTGDDFTSTLNLQLQKFFSLDSDTIEKLHQEFRKRSNLVPLLPP